MLGDRGPWCVQVILKWENKSCIYVKREGKWWSKERKLLIVDADLFSLSVKLFPNKKFKIIYTYCKIQNFYFQSIILYKYTCSNTFYVKHCSLKHCVIIKSETISMSMNDKWSKYIIFHMTLKRKMSIYMYWYRMVSNNIFFHEGKKKKPHKTGIQEEWVYP